MINKEISIASRIMFFALWFIICIPVGILSVFFWIFIPAGNFLWQLKNDFAYNWRVKSNY